MALKTAKEDTLEQVLICAIINARHLKDLSFQEYKVDSNCNKSTYSKAPGQQKFLSLQSTVLYENVFTFH